MIPLKRPFDREDYATNEEFAAFFAARGIVVADVRIDPVLRRRRFTVPGCGASFLEMDASPDECLRAVKAFVASAKKRR